MGWATPGKCTDRVMALTKTCQHFVSTRRRHVKIKIVLNGSIIFQAIFRFVPACRNHFVVMKYPTAVQNVIGAANPALYRTEPEFLLIGLLCDY